MPFHTAPTELYEMARYYFYKFAFLIKNILKPVRYAKS